MTKCRVVCNWVINWGDVPTWIGAIGALGALLWAIILYSNNLRDQRRSQARLLAPVGGTVPLQDLPGTPVDAESVGFTGMFRLTPEHNLVVAAETVKAKVRLVSTSDETFSGLRAWLLVSDGREVYFPLGFDEMAPHEEKVWTVYYRPDEIVGGMAVQLQFQDANGRWWERVNGRPVRELRSGPKPHPPRT